MGHVSCWRNISLRLISLFFYSLRSKLIDSDLVQLELNLSQLIHNGGSTSELSHFLSQELSLFCFADHDPVPLERR